MLRSLKRLTSTYLLYVRASESIGIRRCARACARVNVYTIHAGSSVSIPIQGGRVSFIHTFRCGQLMTRLLVLMLHLAVKCQSRHLYDLFSRPITGLGQIT